jgi:hypothetical protein
MPLVVEMVPVALEAFYPMVLPEAHGGLNAVLVLFLELR